MSMDSSVTPFVFLHVCVPFLVLPWHNKLNAAPFDSFDDYPLLTRSSQQASVGIRLLPASERND